METNSKGNKTKEVFEKVVKNLQEIVENGEYEKFLKFQKKLNNKYSFNNIVLIFTQFPDATQVAGRKKWLDLGRTVTQNAQSIAIIAPIPKKFVKVEKVIEDGEEVKKETTYDYCTYRYAYVYDISQTTGKEIPLQTQDINGDEMEDFYEKLKAFSKVPVKENDLYGGTKGYYSEKKNEIVIKKTLSVDDKTATLLHEITHSLYDDFDYSKNRDLSEVFVESVAYIVADHFGLDTSCCSFNYIAQWAEGEPKTVIDLGNKILKSANEFIDALEKYKTEKVELVA